MNEFFSAVRDRFYFLAVGAYLSCVMLFLLISGRLDPGISFSRLVRGAIKRRAKGDLKKFESEDGFCFVVHVPTNIISDADGRSRIRVYENGELLEGAHSGHAEIRAEGHGRFSHWNDRIYLSTSDNTDPRDNGRQYHFAE